MSEAPNEIPAALAPVVDMTPAVEVAPQGMVSTTPLPLHAHGGAACAAPQAPASAQPLGYMPPQDDHRALRTSRLKWSILTSLLTKPLAFVAPIITVPLFLKYLGADRYGLFESIGALTVWLTLTNAGLTLGLINKLTDCHVSGDRETARRYVTSLIFVLLGSTLVVSLLVTLIVPAVNWSAVFRSDSVLGRRETPWAVWAASLATVWGLLVSVPQAIYAGYQENHRNNIWDGISKAVTLIACIAVVRTSWGLVGVILAAAGSAVLIRTINILVLFTWEKPWLLPLPRYFDRALLLGTMKQGVGLFVIASSALGIFQADKLVISHFVGADAVAQYSIIGRPFMLVFGVYSMVLSPLWPAHGEALRRGDVDWARRALLTSMTFGWLAMLACGTVMFFFGDLVLRVWRVHGIAVSHSLVLAMTAVFVLWTWMTSISVLLNSANVLRAQMWFIGLHALLNVIVACLVAPRYGTNGVAWSISLTGIVTSAWGYPWMLRRYVLRPARGAAPAAAANVAGALA